MLAAGVPAEWLAARHRGEGPAHPHGPLSYSLDATGGQSVLELAGGAQVPPGGFVLVWPGRQPPPATTRVNGKPARWEGKELRFRDVPATVVIGGST